MHGVSIYRLVYIAPRLKLSPAGAGQGVLSLEVGPQGDRVQEGTVHSRLVSAGGEGPSLDEPERRGEVSGGHSVCRGASESRSLHRQL
jgi:hypothetical protein